MDSLDYQRIAKAIAYLRANYRQPARLADVAAHVGLSESHFQRLFTRWAGVSPKRFQQYLFSQDAAQRLQSGVSVLQASLDTDVSSPGRLHDLLVTVTAMTPAEVARRGEGLSIRYGVHDSPFGACLVGLTDRGLCFLGFLRDGQTPEATLAERFPRATLLHEPQETAALVARLFDPGQWSAEKPLALCVAGSNFQLKVWEALLRIPRGGAASYSDIARWIGRPKAARAVGTAVGRNPVSLIIPCHRVLRESGALGGYHWGLSVKEELLAWERAEKNLAQRRQEREASQRI